MQISIHDYENNRLIIGRVPSYLADADRSSDDIAQAILTALGLSEGSSEYMVGEFEVVLADHNADSNREARGIELLTQNFKEDALAALEDTKD